MEVLLSRVRLPSVHTSPWNVPVSPQADYQTAAGRVPVALDVPDVSTALPRGVTACPQLSVILSAPEKLWEIPRRRIL